jgi:peptidoglycan/LPS O-acetylase OafA/YrhL
MYIPQITFTRFLAAFTIVVFHFGRDVFPFNMPSIENLFAVHRDVSYFFLLSGFVMTMAYIHRTKTVTTMRYWAACILRLYPVYLLGLILILIGYAVHGLHSIDGTSLMVNIFALQAWSPGYCLSFNFPTWAVSVQLFFYFLFPFLLAFLKKVSASAQITITILFWLLTQILYVLLIQGKGTPGNTTLIWLLKYSPLFQTSCFLFGVTGAMLFGRIQKRISPGQSLACLVGSFITIGIIVLLMPHPSRQWLRNGMLSPLFLLFLVGLSTDRTVISRVISKNPFLILGELSYALFILHAPVQWYSIYLFDLIRIPHNGPLRFYVYLLLLMTASYVCYRFFERPLRARAKGLLRGGPSQISGG